DQEFCMCVGSAHVTHAVVSPVSSETFMEVLYIVIVLIFYIMPALSGCIIPCFTQYSCIFRIAVGFCIHPAGIVIDIICVIFTLELRPVFPEGSYMVIGTDVIKRHIMNLMIA